MRFGLFAIGLALAALPRAAATRPHAPLRELPPPPLPAEEHESHPLRSLPMLASVQRVRLEIARDRILIVEDIGLPRGDWHDGALEAYVAFPTPGPPVAMDARLIPVAEGQSEAAADASGESVPIEIAPRARQGTDLILGKAQAAGATVRLRESLLRRTFAGDGAGVLRLRLLLHAPSADADGRHEVIVRLGRSGSVPMTLQRIEAAAVDPKTPLRGESARLCGPDADSWPLRIETPSAKGAQDRHGGAPIAPSMAVRHSTDDLCVTWW